MSKAKESIEELRAKLFDRKKQEVVEAADKVIAESLNLITYDIIQDPDVQGRSFLIVKIKYDIKTKTAVVIDIMPFQNKTVGLTIQKDKENLKYFYEQNGGKK
jgi:carbonic anhydrase